MPNARVAIFLDHSDIESVSRDMNIIVDYGKLLKWLADRSAGRELVYAIAYVSAHESQTDLEIEAIETKLGKDGYAVKTIISGHEKRTATGFEIVMDMVKVSYEFEPQIIVLVNNKVSDEISPAIDYLVRETNTCVEVANFSGCLPQGCINRIDLSLASDAVS